MINYYSKKQSQASISADVLTDDVDVAQVRNLRSGVSRVAVCTLGDLYTHLQKSMDQELEGTVKALLQKAGESNAFIRQDVDAALDCMVQHCTPTRSIGALLSGGLRSVCVAVNCSMMF